MISLNILFANDDVLTQWVMTDVLTGAGFTVASACRGQQVIDLLRDSSDYDVLLIDTALLETENEAEIGQIWRKALPGRPLIFTGPPRDALRLQLHQNESFLCAPFSAGALLRAIDGALEDAFFRPIVPAPSNRSHHVH